MCVCVVRTIRWVCVIFFSYTGNDVRSMQRERQSVQLKGCVKPPNYFPGMLVEQTYFSGCSSMWARALFIQDDTLHIHSSTSRQTSTDLGSPPASPEKKNIRKDEFERSDGMWSVFPSWVPF